MEDALLDGYAEVVEGLLACMCVVWVVGRSGIVPIRASMRSRTRDTNRRARQERRAKLKHAHLVMRKASTVSRWDVPIKSLDMCMSVGIITLWPKGQLIQETLLSPTLRLRTPPCSRHSETSP